MDDHRRLTSQPPLDPSPIPGDPPRKSPSQGSQAPQNHHGQMQRPLGIQVISTTSSDNSHQPAADPQQQGLARSESREQRPHEPHDPALPVIADQVSSGQICRYLGPCRHSA